MGAKLTIERLEEMAWRWYQADIATARIEREKFKQKMRRWFGREQADRIGKIVQAAIEPETTGPMPYLCRLADRAFVKLATLELAMREIMGRVEALSSFTDPYTAEAVLPTLGLSWWVDVQPLIQGPVRQGFMPAENVARFLEMVRNAPLQFPTRKQIEERGGVVERGNDLSDWHGRFRGQRRRLIAFLERAARLGEGLWCSL